MKKMYLKADYHKDKTSDLYLKYNESFQIIMQPIKFLRWKSDSKLGDNIYLFLLQDTLHELLYYFVNGSYLRKEALLFFPAVDYCSSEIYSCIFDDLSFLLTKLNSRYRSGFVNFANALQSLPNCKRIAPRLIAEIISTLYSEIEEVFEKSSVPTNEISVSIYKKMDEKEYLSRDTEYLTPVIELRKYVDKWLKNYLIDFYIHGSMCTLDYAKGWSDLDTCMIVKREVMTDKNRLLKLRYYAYQATKFFYMIDPMQHHGHFILTEQDMHCYPQAYFPFVLLEHSTSFFRPDNKLTFWERDSTIENLNFFWKWCYEFRERYLKDEKPNSLYELKGFFHHITMLPAAFIQAGNQFVYKKYSFEKAKKEFINQEGWNIIDKITDIRKNWRYGKLTNGKFERLFAGYPNPVILSIMHKKLKNKIPDRIKKTLGNDYLYEIFRLSESMLEERGDRFAI